jgi:uncharacterized membrane protein AbrB (regulator of aidB expression)
MRSFGVMSILGLVTSYLYSMILTRYYGFDGILNYLNFSGFNGPVPGGAATMTESVSFVLINLLPKTPNTMPSFDNMPIFIFLMSFSFAHLELGVMSILGLVTSYLYSMILTRYYGFDGILNYLNFSGFNGFYFYLLILPAILE